VLKSTQEQWYEHFRGLVNVEVAGAGTDPRGAGETIDCNELNAEITEMEVRDAVRRLKSGKAGGMDLSFSRDVEIGG
jgi:hypothetical protein